MSGGGQGAAVRGPRPAPCGGGGGGRLLPLLLGALLLAAPAPAPEMAVAEPAVQRDAELAPRPLPGPPQSAGVAPVERAAEVDPRAFPGPPPSGSVAAVQLDAAVDTTRLTVGDRLTLTVRIDHDPAVEIILPPPTLALPDGIEQVGFAHPAPAQGGVRGGRVVERLIWQLRTWQVGRFTLPAVAVTYLGGDGQEERVASLPLDLEVVSVRRGGEETPRPMTGPVALPINWRLGAMAGGLGVLFAAGVVAGIAAWRRRPRPTPAPPPAPAADQIALAALVRLAHSEAFAHGDAEQVATRLSAITRHYLEQRLAFPALESTTREVEEWLSHCAAVDPTLRATLLDLLFATDRVKFAQGWATVDELTAQIDRARTVVLRLAGAASGAAGATPEVGGRSSTAAAG